MSAVGQTEARPEAVNVSTNIVSVVAEIESALERVGIREDDPIRPVFAGLIDLFERVRREAVEVKGTRQAAEAGIALMKKATERCTAETLKLERMFGTMEVRSHNLVTQTITSMADRVAEQMRDRMVIVERRHNRIALWRRAGVLAATVVGIFLVGFAAAEYSDHDATDLMDRCMAHPFVNTQTGGLVCEVGSPRPGR
jgi:hypothetical protein